MTTQPAIGHNNPPTEQEILNENLSEQHKELLEQGRNLMRAAKGLPDKIEDTEQEAVVVEHIKKFQTYMKNLDKSRTDAKKPHLDAGRWIDTFFKNPADAFTAAKAKLEGRVLAYKREVAAAEAERRRQEAAEQAAEAERQRKAAEALQEEGNDKEAAALEKQADRADAKAERLTQAPVTASTKTTAGVTSGIVKRWVGQIDNVEKINLNVLRFYFTDSAIQQAVNNFVKSGGRELEGVSIYQEDSVTVR